jgi:hypothetical protein
MTVNLNANVIYEKIDGRIKKIQSMVDLRVMKDSNYYCPMDTGTLQDSVILSYKEGSGVLTWDTEYAKSQYYGLANKSKDDNPNAVMKWFEVAKTRNINKWVRFANDRYSKQS